MSRQFRDRAAGVALTALFVGAPLLVADAAHAGQAEDDRQLVFGGGATLSPSCVAEPDRRAIKVPAKATVRVVNNTGHRAELQLNGRSHGTIAENGSTRVVFRRGTVAVTLELDCVPSAASAVVQVTAEPSAEPSTGSLLSTGIPEPTPTATPTPSESDSAAPSSLPVSSESTTPGTSAGRSASTTAAPPASPLPTQPLASITSSLDRATSISPAVNTEALVTAGLGMTPDRVASRHRVTQGGATQHRVTQGGATQHPATQHRATQGGATQHRVTQGGATQHPATQHPATQHPATQHPATQHRATQGGATQHRATQGGVSEAGIPDATGGEPGGTSGGSPMPLPADDAVVEAGAPSASRLPDDSTPTTVAAAEPVAALELLDEAGPGRLLALTATLCVVGVTVSLIRTFLAQRANRS